MRRSRKRMGEVDYLVLLGDIIDFSVASYAEAYRQARAFFVKLQNDGVVRQIIYVPGNHDFDVWLYPVEEPARSLPAI